MNSAADSPCSTDPLGRSRSELEAPDLRGEDDVDPDDEDAAGDPTGFGEADLDPDDDA